MVAGAARAAAVFGLDTSFLDTWRRAKLVLLDAGMATRLSRAFPLCFVALLPSLVGKAHVRWRGHACVPLNSTLYVLPPCLKFRVSQWPSCPFCV